MITRLRCRSATNSVMLGLGIAGFLGAGLVSAACRMAAVGDDGSAHFAVFWLGMGILQVPAFVLLLRPRQDGRTASLGILFLALADSLPKYLREPAHLVFYDELAHYRQTEAVLQAHALFQGNPLVPILRDYPGLHAVSATLSMLCAISTLDVALLLLVLLHLLALGGISLLAETLGLPLRAAGLAVCLYSINPGFLYFDAQYAYESLGVVLVIWQVVFLARAEAASRLAVRWRWSIVALLTAIACALTHHVSSYVLAALALLITAFWLRALPRHTTSLSAATPILVCTVLSCAAVAGWTIEAGQTALTYFGPRMQELVASILRVAASPVPQRALFAGSTTPPYERATAFLSPVLTVVLTMPGICFRDVRPVCPHTWSALRALAICYVPSCALMFTSGGQEIARRSWSFAAIGLALVTAYGLARRVMRLPLVRDATTSIAFALLLYVTGLGNTAMQTNELYRFPGPVQIGTDVRTQTAELLDTVQWFTRSQGTGKRIVADRDDALAFAAFGGVWTAPAWRGLPIWELFLSPAELPNTLLFKLVGDRYDYLILDRRIASELPHIGYYVSPQEPQAYHRVRPVPQEALARYTTWPCAIGLLQTDHLTLYRLFLPPVPRSEALRVATDDGPEPAR